METKTLFQKLDSTFSNLVKDLGHIENDIFFYKEKAEKWSIAEELQHLTLSILPINNLLSQPIAVTERWGPSKRKSRNMEVFLNDYKKATMGREWKAFPPFVPKTENENPNYTALHHTSDQLKIKDFYKLTGNQIQRLRDLFPITGTTRKKDIIQQFSEQSTMLLAISKQMDDKQMDDIQLPLPYIGLVTFKEALYFTLDHTWHHYNSIIIATKENDQLGFGRNITNTEF